MISCYQFKNQISLYIDDEMNFQKRTEFEGHLETCPNCKKLLGAITATKARMHNFNTLSVSAGFYTNLQNRILADRNARIRAARQKGFSFHKIPSFAYGFAAAFLAVVAGFMIMKTPPNAQPGALQLPVAQQQIQKAPPAIPEAPMPPVVQAPQTRYAATTQSPVKEDSSVTGDALNSPQHKENLQDLQQRIKTVKDQN